ncbi:MipA/OmpV family protein [Burkholderia sp. BCC1998]|uniref:MipA/OmpV family protein n=1 Tax=Burkholderia sp. BCC1998 TaxID=2817447 RepID=UPI002AB7920F|nr:MipA/OmpV family protein [Burkholderia sp. BCC1998]
MHQLSERGKLVAIFIRTTLCTGTRLFMPLVQADERDSAAGQQRTVDELLRNRTDFSVGIAVGVEQRYTGATTVDLKNGKLGDGQFDQTYFGVSPMQSARSGFKRYAPGPGIDAYALTVSWEHILNRHRTTDIAFGGTRYTDNVSITPVGQRSFGVSLFIMAK